MTAKKVEILDLMNPSLDTRKNARLMQNAAKEIKALREAVDTGIRCMEQRNEVLEEVERLTKLVDNISYTAKNRKKKMHKYRDALIDIGTWKQESQDWVEKTNNGLGMWRGCVAVANMALELGGDAVEGQYKVYPEGYLKAKEEER